MGGTGKSGKKNLLMNQKLREIEQCLTTIGFKRHEIENIYKILSAVLHLGDIKIEADTHEAHISEAACISRNDEVLKFGMIKSCIISHMYVLTNAPMYLHTVYNPNPKLTVESVI